MLKLIFMTSCIPHPQKIIQKNTVHWSPFVFVPVANCYIWKGTYIIILYKLLRGKYLTQLWQWWFEMIETVLLLNSRLHKVVFKIKVRGENHAHVTFYFILLPQTLNICPLSVCPWTNLYVMFGFKIFMNYKIVGSL